VVLGEKPVVTTENLIWTGVGLNQGCHSEMLASNCPRNGVFQTARLASQNFACVHTHVVVT